MRIYADLADFGLGPMVRLVAELRDCGRDAKTYAEFAQCVCTLLHESFVGQDGQPQTALVRMYATARAGDLPPALQPDLPAATTCLTLLGTVGTEDAWNDRNRSVGHQSLPLVDEEHVARLPMVAALLEQLGVDVRALTAAEAEVMLPAHDGSCRIFYVPVADGSPLIPAQDFVRAHEIASAVGFGGALPGGEVFAVVLFSKVGVPLASAELLETVALSLSLAALEVAQAPLLEVGGPPRGLGDLMPARVELSWALVQAHERASAVEAERAMLAQARSEHDARRTASLAAVAMRLGNVQSVGEIPDVLVSEGLTVLGAEGVSIALVDESRLTASLVISSAFGDEVAQAYAVLPLDDALPTTYTARTGKVVLVEDSEGEHDFPAFRAVARAVGTRSVAVLPLRVGERLIGALTCTWPQPHQFDASGLEVMGALAAQVAQAADRARLIEREREHSSALQRSLLSDPPEVAHSQIQVRYLPAERAMAVGGDWYDVFVHVDGDTALVIGDVVGHDTAAAAAMGQIRGLLRGIAWPGGGPAEVLGRVDEAIDGLALGVTATAVLGRLTPDGLLRWCNAGHPPPMLVQGSAVVELGGPEADLLLGVDARTGRCEEALTLQPGATVVFYTDGLVERRGRHLQEGLDLLRGHLGELGGLPLGELCDELLGRMRPGADDDIALLAVRWTG